MEVLEMKTPVNKIDLTILPDHLKKELIDFYQFLVARYGIKKVKKKKRFQKIISNPLKVSNIIILPREELHER